MYSPIQTKGIFFRLYGELIFVRKAPKSAISLSSKIFPLYRSIRFCPDVYDRVDRFPRFLFGQSEKSPRFVTRVLRKNGGNARFRFHQTFSRFIVRFGFVLTFTDGLTAFRVFCSGKAGKARVFTRVLRKNGGNVRFRFHKTFSVLSFDSVLS